LLEEKELFFDYNPSVLSGMIEPDKQQFFFGIREKIRITEGLIETGKKEKTVRQNPTENITRHSPRILQELPTDSRFDQVRAFLNGLEEDNGKLVWPCRYINRRVQAPDRRFKQGSLAWMMKRLFPNLDPTSLAQKTSEYFQYENGDIDPAKSVRAFWGGNDDSRVSRWLIRETGLGDDNP